MNAGPLALFVRIMEQCWLFLDGVVVTAEMVADRLSVITTL